MFKYLEFTNKPDKLLKEDRGVIFPSAATHKCLHILKPRFGFRISEWHRVPHQKVWRELAPKFQPLDPSPGLPTLGGPCAPPG